LDRIFQSGLVAFHKSDLELEGYDLTVEAHRVPVVTYPSEWPTGALRDVALTFLNLVIALGDAGFGIKDGHPWNLLLERRTPVFVDLGSITDTPSASWLREFQRTLVVPIALHHYGLHNVAEQVIADHRGLGASRAFAGLVRRFFPPTLSGLNCRQDPIAVARALERWLSRINLSGRRMAWSFYDQHATSHADLNSFSPKQRTVHRILGDTKPGTVLDLAANAGWYSELSASLGHRVIAADVDDAALTRMYGRLASSPLPIECARLDVVWPKGSYGMGLLNSDPYARLRSDTVLALALLHHLAGRQGVTFSMFASIIDRLAIKRAVVEFVPSDDLHVRSWALAAERWYTKANLIEAFSTYFSRVEEYPSSPNPRCILVFDR
jgi:hypothetical protein